MFRKFVTLFKEITGTTESPLYRRLKRLGITDTDAPKEFLCLVSFSLMEDPISYQPVASEAIIQAYIIDRSSYDQLSTDATTGMRICPFTRGIIEHVAPLPELKMKIEAYVEEKEQQHAPYQHLKAPIEQVEQLVQLNLHKRKEGKATPRVRSIQFQKHQDIITLTGFPVEVIPTEFQGHYQQCVLLDFPVVLDETFVIDYFDLKAHWDKNSEVLPADNFIKYHHPVTNEILKSIAFATGLYTDIRCFIRKIEIEHLKKQLPLIDDIIKSTKEQTPAHERFLERFKELDVDVAIASVPESFIGANFVNRIMNHPVILDADYRVDYDELQLWWENEKNTYLNFYTGLPVRKIEYDTQLKKRIEDFLAPKIENVAATEPAPLTPLAQIGLYATKSTLIQEINDLKTVEQQQTYTHG